MNLLFQVCQNLNKNKAMCRLLVCPKNFSQEEAIDILLEMEGKNTDGTGFCYIKNNQFVVEKYPYSLSRVLRKNKNFLLHMPYNGPTVIHLRSSTHGANNINNTHPFIINNRISVIHNGVFHDSEILRLALSKFVKFDGETDSEIGAWLIDLIGPEKFSKEIDMAGVFIVLHINGELSVIKTSGQLELNYLPNKSVLISSELEYEKYPRATQALNGYYLFNKNGEYIKHKPTQMFNFERQFCKSKKLKYIKINGKEKGKEKDYFYNRLPVHYMHEDFTQSFID